MTISLLLFAGLLAIMMAIIITKIWADNDRMREEIEYLRALNRNQRRKLREIDKDKREGWCFDE